MDSSTSAFVPLELQAKKNNKESLERDRNQIKQGSILKVFEVLGSHHHKGNLMIVSFLYKSQDSKKHTWLQNLDNWEIVQSINYKLLLFSELKTGEVSENGNVSKIV